MDEPLNDPLCGDEQRRAEVFSLPLDLNGIDFVECRDDTFPPRLDVVFVKTTTSIPIDLVGKPDLFRIEGGMRITGIRVTKVEAGTSLDRLKVTLDAQGDFSFYRLVITHPKLDPRLDSAVFRFRASCPTEIDCRQETECPPETVVEPALDYLAKDYASFRQLLLDLIPQRNPGWVERNPADLGIALVELLAYAGDHLSYFQDAVATEAYLDTCRQRVSAKRHARMIDYRMHDGRNAWTFAHLEVSDDGTVPRKALLLTRIGTPLQKQTAPPGVSINESDLQWGVDPALRKVTVFETTAPVKVATLHNRLRIHTWSDVDCCLPRGATGVALYGVDGSDAVQPMLAIGDYLLLEEVRGPSTGLEADADPEHRHVVRLIDVKPLKDPVYKKTLDPQGRLQPATGTVDQLELLAVFWSESDALPFPLCISKRPAPDIPPWENLSVARGNVVPCDHGRTVCEKLDLPVQRGNRAGGVVTSLKQGPLTFQAFPFGQEGHGLAVSPRDAVPAVELELDFPPNETDTWFPVPHLLDSTALDQHFVVDVDAAGRAEIRFGDDEYGRRPAGTDKVVAHYRIGNGPAGNLGREALVHVARPAVLPTITKVRQPLPAVGGTAAETIEEVRQLAPRAFQSETFRAVTEEDYEAAALKLSAVLAAKATFRWTGSWHTVFVAAHPRNPADLITLPGGRTQLSDDLARKLRAHLTRYKLAGYDLEVLTARYVPLEIALRICVAPGHFRGDALEGVRRALSNRAFPRGEFGFFHPSRFAFGQPVYISRLYEVVEKVPGVESAVITVFKRYWELAGDELANGVIPLGEGEIARLDNDPNFAENGVLRVTAVGGL